MLWCWQYVRYNGVDSLGAWARKQLASPTVKTLTPQPSALLIDVRTLVVFAEVYLPQRGLITVEFFCFTTSFEQASCR
jgi:hypothetical protein